MKGCRSMIYWFIHRVITPINGLINQWVSLFFLNLLIGAQELHVYLVFGLYTNISNQNPPVLTIISSSFAGLPISVFLPTQGVLPAAGRHWAKRNQETFHHPRSGERFANKQGMLSRAKPYISIPYTIHGNCISTWHERLILYAIFTYMKGWFLWFSCR